ncbi:MAG TPA: hypothetical protein VJR25_08780 [Microbacterium sp.]|uniref:hypothetical protein n=1 Tax=Microbacterium sp. TaxID=51671 RepID=UPI002B47F404|nr:hypothetical protein [Microbacterium sp.]HKT56854.1 hypothetical protein [Microbacterium sp.]
MIEVNGVPVEVTAYPDQLDDDHPVAAAAVECAEIRGLWTTAPTSAPAGANRAAAANPAAETVATNPRQNIRPPRFVRDRRLLCARSRTTA